MGGKHRHTHSVPFNSKTQILIPVSWQCQITFMYSTFICDFWDKQQKFHCCHLENPVTFYLFVLMSIPVFSMVYHKISSLFITKYMEQSSYWEPTKSLDSQ